MTIRRFSGPIPKKYQSGRNLVLPANWSGQVVVVEFCRLAWKGIVWERKLLRQSAMIAQMLPCLRDIVALTTSGIFRSGLLHSGMVYLSHCGSLFGLEEPSMKIIGAFLMVGGGLLCFTITLLGAGLVLVGFGILFWIGGAISTRKDAGE